MWNGAPSELRRSSAIWRTDPPDWPSGKIFEGESPIFSEPHRSASVFADYLARFFPSFLPSERFFIIGLLFIRKLTASPQTHVNWCFLPFFCIDSMLVFPIISCSYFLCVAFYWTGFSPEPFRNNIYLSIKQRLTSLNRWVYLISFQQSSSSFIHFWIPECISI